MRHYQCENKTVGKCVTNTQYLIDCIRYNLPHLSAKAIPAIAKSGALLTIHMVVTINGRIVDPSYEICSMDNVQYYRTIGDLASKVDVGTGDFTKRLLSEFIVFTKLADRINNKEDIVITDKEYYDGQADFIDKFPLRLLL